MCAGVAGPGGPPNEYRSSYVKEPRRTGYGAKKKLKFIKQRRVPYNNHSGNVVACWEGHKKFAQLYQSKKTGEWIASWSSVLSSGSAGWKSRRQATIEYNKHVPEDRRIKLSKLK